MAEDYLTDDEQLENVKRIVAENWLWVVGGVVLGAAIIFGYRFYDTRRNDIALRAAGEFQEISAALATNDEARVKQAAAALIKEYPASPYADQAKLVLARMAVDSGKLADARAPLTDVMNDSKDDELKHIARLRLARVLIADNKADQALQMLTVAAPGAFAGSYHEVRGDAFYAKNDTQGAITEYKAALASGDPASPESGLLQLKMADLGTPPSSTSKAKP
ncbi:MAG: YfgM family protein [Steroidobacteraceae bacterium]